MQRPVGEKTRLDKCRYGHEGNRTQKVRCSLHDNARAGHVEQPRAVSPSGPLFTVSAVIVNDGSLSRIVSLLFVASILAVCAESTAGAASLHLLGSTRNIFGSEQPMT